MFFHSGRKRACCSRIFHNKDVALSVGVLVHGAICPLNIAIGVSRWNEFLNIAVACFEIPI